MSNAEMVGGWFALLKCTGCIAGMIVLCSLVCLSVICIRYFIKRIQTCMNRDIVDADLLRRDLNSLGARHSDSPDWQNCLYNVECIIKSLIE